MAAGENDGYDTILHKISQYDTIRSQKRSAIFNGKHPKINVAFSLTPSHTFTCAQTPSTVVDGIRNPSTNFDSVRTHIKNLAFIDFSSILTNVRTSSSSFERH